MADPVSPELQLLREVLRLLVLCDARTAYEASLHLDPANPINVQIMRLIRSGSVKEARIFIREVLGARPRNWSDFEQLEMRLS